MLAIEWQWWARGQLASGGGGTARCAARWGAPRGAFLPGGSQDQRDSCAIENLQRKIAMLSRFVALRAGAAIPSRNPFSLKQEPNSGRVGWRRRGGDCEASRGGVRCARALSSAAGFVRGGGRCPQWCREPRAHRAEPGIEPTCRVFGHEVAPLATMDWRLFGVHDPSNALFAATRRCSHYRKPQTPPRRKSLHTAGLLLHHDLLLRDSAASDDLAGLGTRPHVDREAEHPRVTAHRLLGQRSSHAFVRDGCEASKPRFCSGRVFRRTRGDGR